MSYAAVFSITTAVVPIYGTKRLGFRNNFNLMMYAAAGSLGSFLAATLRSSTGTYKWAFMWNASAWLVVIALALANLVFYDRKGVVTSTDANIVS